MDIDSRDDDNETETDNEIGRNGNIRPTKKRKGRPSARLAAAASAPFSRAGPNALQVVGDDDNSSGNMNIAVNSAVGSSSISAVVNGNVNSDIIAAGNHITTSNIATMDVVIASQRRFYSPQQKARVATYAARVGRNKAADRLGLNRPMYVAVVCNCHLTNASLLDRVGRWIRAHARDLELHSNNIKSNTSSNNYNITINSKKTPVGNEVIQSIIPANELNNITSSTIEEELRDAEIEADAFNAISPNVVFPAGMNFAVSTSPKAPKKKSKQRRKSAVLPAPSILSSSSSLSNCNPVNTTTDVFNDDTGYQTGSIIDGIGNNTTTVLSSPLTLPPQNLSLSDELVDDDADDEDDDGVDTNVQSSFGAAFAAIREAARVAIAGKEL
ncbi:hypothetical protein HK100_000857 [Physocladia obscura]|uniref:Uncharacterized protein n=1 Tax=Physocladia obscura TaxID=109957 RepID=A0AAD5SXP4_9FUNG|nr:hypothetical protein HK100_000857 [Physocladia obscura]